MLAHAISRAMGMFANHTFSPSIQKIINSSYCNLLGLNMDEFLKPDQYNTLCALFTRSLCQKREINNSLFICPTDSFVMAQGEITDDTALQIKGKTYNVSEFVGTKEHGLNSGEFVNFYLSPKDYHRYHAPCDMQVIYAKHIPGELFPVNRPALNYVKALFARNERVVLKCKYDGVVFFLVFVGALNVGKMKFGFDERIQTNVKATKVTSYEYKKLHFKKGDELGYFELGSTVVMLAPKNFQKLQNLSGQKVRFGQGLSA